jgi:hypothetical protein|tara:strand:- start:518 stop:700 length:183 start_codon:yes stop_codon:yes gene_type:complete
VTDALASWPPPGTEALNVKEAIHVTEALSVTEAMRVTKAMSERVHWRSSWGRSQRMQAHC